MTSSTLSYVLAFIALYSVSGAKYMYNAGSASCAGTTSDPCGPNYWFHTPGYEACENVADSKQTPIDFSNVELDEELENPEFEVEEGGCDVSTLLSLSITTNLMYFILVLVLWLK